MFLLQDKLIDSTQAKNSFSNPSTGALVSFEGIVRNDQNQGMTVSSLLYIANAEECIKEGEKILSEALKLFPVTHVLCIQRIGPVNVGEAATWIGVWSSHRDEAFKACRYMIEETKKRLLIWKKELYTNGSSQWIRGAETPVIL